MVLTSQVNYSHNTFLLNRYDSLTGVPVSQQNLLLEKASILFNIGALYTQIGTRCNRQTQAGLEGAMDAFQKAAGASPRGLLGTPTEVALWVLPRSQGPERARPVSSTAVISHQGSYLMFYTLLAPSGSGLWLMCTGNPMVND